MEKKEKIVSRTKSKVKERVEEPKQGVEEVKEDKKVEEKAEFKAEPVKTEKKKSNLPKIIGICCGVILLFLLCSGICGLIYFFVIKKNDKGGPIYDKSPNVDIIAPTGSNWYSTSSKTISLSGLANDPNDDISKVIYEKSGESELKADGTKTWKTGEISLNPGDNKIRVTAIDKKGNKGEDSIFIVYNEENIQVGELKINPGFLFKDDPEVEVSFTVTVVDKSGTGISNVKLLKVQENGEVESEVIDLLDNGIITNGDDIPNDGTFSAKIKLKATTKDPLYYRVAVKSALSKSVMSAVSKLIIVDHISQTTQQQIENLNAQVSNLINQLQNSGKPQNQIANQVNTFVSQQPGISSSGISQQGNGVWWVYENTCIPGGVLFNPPGSKGGKPSGKPTTRVISQSELVSKVDAQNEIQVGNTKALYLGPYLNQFAETDDYYGAWQKIKESQCPQCETVEKKNEEVTVDDFKTLSNYGLVIVSSHGDNWYGGLSGDDMCAEGLKQSQVIIYTSQKLTASNIKNYEADLMARRLAVGVDNNLIILPAFISYYNSSFPNSLIYIATCRSSYNNTLASAFLGKGASAFYGFDDYVLSSYCLKAGTKLFSDFVLQSKKSGESYSATISEVGGSDGKGADFIFNGSPDLIIGGTNFANGSFEDGNVNSWSPSGDARIVTSLGSLKPTNGSFMGIISTGLGSVSNSVSSLSQTVCSKVGASTISFDYNVVSEEPTEFIGYNNKYDDKLQVFIVVDGQKTKILEASVNNSTWVPVSGIDFAGGDKTTFQTGWKNFSYSLAGIPAGKSFQVLFEVSDVGDSAYDTAAIIDNVTVQ